MPQISIDSTELPTLKPHTHCVLIPRDPNCIFAYWDYTEEDIDRIRHRFKIDNGDFQLILRVYDISLNKFNGSNANHAWDLEVGFSVHNTYIQVWQDNADYCVELGIRGGHEHFIPLVRSNRVHTPPKSASKRDDLIWQDIKANKLSRPYIKENLKKKNRSSKSKEGRTYHLSTQDVRSYYMKSLSGLSKKGRGASLEEILKGKLKSGSWQKVRPFITGHDLMMLGASMGLIEKKGVSSEESLSFQGGASEGRLTQKKFFFEVWTELIIHGRTETDAAVWLNQKGIKLNPDGTFSLRFALPDGEIPLKFMAQSSDASQQIHIDTRVEREKTISFPKILKDF